MTNISFFALGISRYIYIHSAKINITNKKKKKKKKEYITHFVKYLKKMEINLRGPKIWPFGYTVQSKNTLMHCINSISVHNCFYEYLNC